MEEYIQVKLGGLWKNTTKTGKTYLSGTLGYDANIQIWPNKKRDGKEDPDYNIYISQKKHKKLEDENVLQENNEVPF